MSDLNPVNEWQRLTGKSESASNKAISFSLFAGGLVLSLASLNQICFSAFPLALLKPEWQLGFVGSIISNGVVALIGFLLICTSEAFDRNSASLANRVLLAKNVSYWVAIAYFLFIPIMSFSGVKLIRQRAALEEANLTQWKKLSSGVKAAASEADLITLLKSLPQAPRLPSKFDAPFQVVKEKIQSQVDSRLNALKNEVDIARSNRWQTFLVEVFNNIITAFLLGIGFAAMGIIGTSQRTLLQRLQSIFFSKTNAPKRL